MAWTSLQPLRIRSLLVHPTSPVGTLEVSGAAAHCACQLTTHSCWALARMQCCSGVGSLGRARSKLRRRVLALLSTSVAMTKVHVEETVLRAPSGSFLVRDSEKKTKVQHGEQRAHRREESRTHTCIRVLVGNTGCRSLGCVLWLGEPPLALPAKRPVAQRGKGRRQGSIRENAIYARREATPRGRPSRPIPCSAVITQINICTCSAVIHVPGMSHVWWFCARVARAKFVLCIHDEGAVMNFQIKVQDLYHGGYSFAGGTYQSMDDIISLLKSKPLRSRNGGKLSIGDHMTDLCHTHPRMAQHFASVP